MGTSSVGCMGRSEEMREKKEGSVYKEFLLLLRSEIGIQEAAPTTQDGQKPNGLGGHLLWGEQRKGYYARAVEVQASS